MRICLCSDFFYPGYGGIETHVIEIAKQFHSGGIHTVVVTRCRPGYYGLKVIPPGIRVYYLKRCQFGIGASLPKMWYSLPQYRRILLDEKITHVHGHQTPSSIAFEMANVAELMGIKVFFTEHSLFSLGLIGSTHLNATLSPALHACNRVIAVSHVQSANLTQRLHLTRSPTVIPNGIDPQKFTPPQRVPEGYPTIVSVTRFERRRGGEFLPEIIKYVCDAHPSARFIIAGGGSCLPSVQAYLKASNISDRVELLGSVSHSSIPDILRRGHFFLNCSLTDAFCVSIVEAASCGLYVISTDVGGIPEVLIKAHRTLTSPCVESLGKAVLDAIEKHPSMDGSHEIIATSLSWSSVADRLLKIYESSPPTKPLLEQTLTHSGPFASAAAFLYLSTLLVLLYALDLVDLICCN